MPCGRRLAWPRPAVEAPSRPPRTSSRRLRPTLQQVLEPLAQIRHVHPLGEAEVEDLRFAHVPLPDHQVSAVSDPDNTSLRASPSQPRIRSCPASGYRGLQRPAASARPAPRLPDRRRRLAPRSRSAPGASPARLSSATRTRNRLPMCVRSKAGAEFSKGLVR